MNSPTTRPEPAPGRPLDGPQAPEPPAAGPGQPPSTPSDAHPGAQGLAVIVGLRARLVAELDKARTNADLARHPETRLAGDGIAAGLEIALAYLDRADWAQLHADQAAVARVRALAVRWRDTPGRVRAAAELAAVLDETPEAGHRYLSTGCLHGDMQLPDGRTGHEYCQGETGAVGQKTPAQCKFCAAPCVCPCHQAAGR